MLGVVLAPETTTGVASLPYADDKRTDDASTLAKDLLGVTLVPEIMVRSDATSPPSIDQEPASPLPSPPWAPLGGPATAQRPAAFPPRAAHCRLKLPPPPSRVGPATRFPLPLHLVADRNCPLDAGLAPRSKPPPSPSSRPSPPSLPQPWRRSARRGHGVPAWPGLGAAAAPAPAPAHRSRLPPPPRLVHGMLAQPPASTVAWPCRPRRVRACPPSASRPPARPRPPLHVAWPRLGLPRAPSSARPWWCGLGAACPRGLARGAAPRTVRPLPAQRGHDAAWRVRPYPWRMACSSGVRAPASRALARPGARPGVPMAEPRCLRAAQRAARAQLGPGVRATHSRCVSAALRVLAWCT
eukprot:XP_020406570.1 formin-like protein 3 [Zea mays]